MLRSDFYYDLPPDLIAQEPRERGRSRMMIVRPKSGPPAFEHATIAAFPSLLRDGDVVVVNDTRVFPARLFAAPKGAMQKPVELLLTRRIGPMQWETWARPAKRLKPGDVLRFSDALRAEVVEKQSDGTVVVRFEGAADERGFWSEIERIGVTPLPPYIRRETPRAEDRDAYQTVYAARTGAVAAPTAGLHFTTAILEEVRRRATLVNVTLHVGIGTFRPVTAERIADHRMDSETYEIDAAAATTLNAALAEQRRIVAIGTTTVRTLESAVRAGEGFFVPGVRDTSIFITPGFEFEAAGAMLTNFHLPESTLLMLVSAFSGMETIRAAYAEAIRERYMFYSFGDCMFLAGRGGW